MAILGTTPALVANPYLELLTFPSSSKLSYRVGKTACYAKKLYLLQVCSYKNYVQSYDHEIRLSYANYFSFGHKVTTLLASSL